MRRIYLGLLLLFSIPVMAQRTIENWNDGWKFHRGKIAESQLPHLNTASWETVDLPHDFQIGQPWVKPDADEKFIHLDGASFRTRLSARGFKEMGEGWYVKTYTPGTELKGKRILLDFEGIMYVGDVYLNGERVGGTDYGYLGFEMDLSDKLKYGETNTIAVRASTSGPMTSRWYTGGGIFRDVHWVVTDRDLYLARHPLYITTKDNRQVNLQIEVVNRPGEEAVTLGTVIKDATGKEIYNKRQDCFYYSPKEAHDLNTIPSNEIKWGPIILDHPQLWSCETPYLYTAEVTLYDKTGKAVDFASQRFGIRTIEIGPEFGLKVNGKKVLLKGGALHHSLGALGAAAYPRAMEMRLKALKEFGVNHVRTSHNPYSTSFLDLCDEMGILVVDEIYDKWIGQLTGGRKPWIEQWIYDVPEWIRRDRNHPSVILWSLGNEQQTYTTLPFNDFGATAYQLLKTVIHRYDATRQLTVAMHPQGRVLKKGGHEVVGIHPWKKVPAFSLPSPLAAASDVASYNYSYEYFARDGKVYPHMVFYQSEASNSDMGTNFFELDLDKVIGLSYWGPIDYLGESGGWPSKGWGHGSFDLSMQPKPQAYLMRSLFKEEPVVHIGIIDKKADELIWNNVKISTDGMSDHWNRKAGELYDIMVYTNADKVELLINGKSVGVKENPSDPTKRNRIKFEQVEYQPGYAEAVAYKDGKRVAVHRIETTGEVKRLALNSETNTWRADGMDLQFVRVRAVDKKGRRVPSVQQLLNFEVEGDARIVAVDNGDLCSDELHTGNKRTLYNGSALVILRAGHKPGKVMLTVKGEGLKPQKLILETH